MTRVDREPAGVGLSDEERLRSLLEMSADAVLLCDEASRIGYCGPTVQKVLGYAPEELVGRSGLDLVHPDDLESALDILAKASSGPDEHVTFLVRVAHPDRGWRWMEGCCSNHLATPCVGALVVNFRDVTDAVKARAALEESRRHYVSLVESLPAAMFRKDLTGTYTYANARLCELMGLSSLEILGRTDEELFPPELAEQIRRSDQRVLETNAPLSREMPDALASEPGRYVQVVKVPFHDAEGRQAGVQGIFWDITDRRRTEDALRESEAFLRMSQRVGKVGSWQWDLATGRVQWSEGMYPLYGLTPEEFDGTLEGAIRRTHPDDLPGVQGVIERILASGECHPVEYRVLRPDGSEAALWGMGEAIRDSSGAAIQVHGTVMDVTERQRADEERRRLEAQVLHAQKLESLGVLAGGIAHDFNSLLTSMLGYAGLALMKLPADSPATPMLREIERAAQRAAELTHQMLTYSGRGRFVVEPVRLDELVREISTLLRTVVSRKAHILLELRPATIQADATQVRQVVMNLLTNASDALGGEPGTIRVETGVRACGEQELQNSLSAVQVPAGSYAYLVVEDTGCGMSPETQARVFEPFFSTKFTGRGLGMAATLGIVRGHHGAILLRSEEQRGTRFEILLPSSEEFAGPVPAGVPEEVHAGSGTVLVIDDEPGVCRFVQDMLEGCGYRVWTAFDGRAALRVYEEHAAEITAVVLDLTMPEVDGIEFLARLRRAAPDLPVLVMSGYAEQDIADRCSQSGANGFLQKPFQPNDLLRQLERIQSEQRHPSS